MIKILLLDDNEMSLISMRNFLEMIGFSVKAVSCPLEALKASQKDRYALIASDYRLPHMNGINLIQAVRLNQPDIISVLISGFLTQKTIEQARQADIDHLFSKPIDIQEFIQVIEQLIPACNIPLSMNS